ncbi:unnamed protein product [Caenorhabditis auriculariae]|uniref:Uncharacterized protein n=1 Tax=Caenorhabditis auriculariae TaxID=2777116 RepID=A0A8S1HV52_9PELO|nr:unnamed protein product [Caenorhabditis auriculariae]
MHRIEVMNLERFFQDENVPQRPQVQAQRNPGDPCDNLAQGLCGEVAFTVYVSICWIFTACLLVIFQEDDIPKFIIFLFLLTLVMAMVGIVTRMKPYLVPFALGCLGWSLLSYGMMIAKIFNLMSPQTFPLSECTENTLKICSIIVKADPKLLIPATFLIASAFSMFSISAITVLKTMQPLEEFPQRDAALLYPHNIHRMHLQARAAEVGGTNPDSPPRYSTLEARISTAETSPPRYSQWEKLKCVGTVTTTAPPVFPASSSTESIHTGISAKEDS